MVDAPFGAGVGILTGNKRIVIRPMGRMANQMMQLMLATELRNRTSPDVAIVGYDLPDWGLPRPVDTPPPSARVTVLDGHHFNLDKVAFALRTGLFDTVRLRGYGMRLEYYRGPQAHAAMFRANGVAFQPVEDGEILLHVRAEDILAGQHPDYFPLPVCYYERIVDETGLAPVFIGQLDDNPYAALIRKRFSGARFLAPGSAISDFETIRNARHIGFGTTTFAWLAAWFSTSAETIHMPLAGLFSPVHPTAMLIPADEPRYRFYTVPFPSMEARAGLDLTHYLSSPHRIEKVSQPRVAELCGGAIFSQHVRRP